jgi:hypothetical protein
MYSDFFKKKNSNKANAAHFNPEQRYGGVGGGRGARWEALERETGARGLRSIIEDVLLEVQFELPSRGDVKKCVVLHPNLRTHLDRTFLNSHLMRKTRQMLKRRRILVLPSPTVQKTMKNSLRSFAVCLVPLNHCLDP